MQNKNYYVGLDVGTNSVGYAVTDKNYNLCKFKSEPMWGVTLFEEAHTSAERRGFRATRRRLDRRQERVRLIQELFAHEIAKTDENFYKRIKESYLFPEADGDKVRLFGTIEEQKEYNKKYPTIHHLIVELMNNKEPYDARLVYIACAWLVAHRGHFLNELDKDNISEVTDFNRLYDKLVEVIVHDEYALPWSEDIDKKALADALKGKKVTDKIDDVSAVLFPTPKKVPKKVDEQYEYNYDSVIKLLCGGKANLDKLFGKDEYAELPDKSVSLASPDEKLAEIMQIIGDDSKLLFELKAIYDWSVLADILNESSTISEAKVAVYDQHHKDLDKLKRFTVKYLPKGKYNEFFRNEDGEKLKNYVAYIGKHKSSGGAKKPATKEEFCKYISEAFKGVTPDEADKKDFEDMLNRLNTNCFMPKQVDGDNRVIPYQLYYYELKKILKNAEAYIPFLREADEDGITGSEKILSVFEFRVPYYVGPLKENSNSKLNHWMVRKAEGKIYPWNFDKMVDLDKSEEAFIDKMTNSCTYLPDEDVLPKNSLLYSSFEVLNEINNIKINGVNITVEAKQKIYNDIFKNYKNVTPKRIKEMLISNNFMTAGDELTGLDVTVKSSLTSYTSFKKLLEKGLLNEAEVEKIINRAAYVEDKKRFSEWLKREYRNLPEDEIKYITNLKLKGFGRLSKKLLLGVDGVDKETGEYYKSVICAMWKTNNNFNQLLSGKFGFKENIEAIVSESRCDSKTLSDRLDKMYVSNSVKRSIIRTLDILNDIVKAQGHAPERIFIEMARGTEDSKKGRTKSRFAQLDELYKKCESDVRELRNQLKEWGDAANNKLQSDKIFLYFLQQGKCMYTGKPISLSSLMSDNSQYNIDHIYPRSVVKDDSVLNNKVLVYSTVNENKGDDYPIKPHIQEKMYSIWEQFHKIGLITDEKFKRLTRKKSFSDDERYEFINRQLVETRQSTKAIAELIKERYPKTDMVYVKAGLVSDFRKEFELPKSRTVNDLHHAKDAYLNIVTGNVWHHKFSKEFWRNDAVNNAKPEVVFTRLVNCNGDVIWNGASDIKRIKTIASENTAHIANYAFCRKGGYFDQNPLPAAKGLTPLKAGRPTEIYGGYNKSTVSFFVLVKYKAGKKQDVMVMPVELLYSKRFMCDDAFALDYAKQTINKNVETVEFLLNKRKIKVNTLLSLNGFKVCITGKTGDKIGLSCLMPFKITPEKEAYIKRLESFNNKHTKNSKISLDEKFDKISSAENLALYDCYIDKLKNFVYKYRPNNQLDIIQKGREWFIALSTEEQLTVLLQIHGLFGREATADLSLIGGKKGAGSATLSLNISNWKKYYTDVRIIDQSASGLFERVSDNLLNLL